MENPEPRHLAGWILRRPETLRGASALQPLEPLYPGLQAGSDFRD